MEDAIGKVIDAGRKYDSTIREIQAGVRSTKFFRSLR